MTATAVRALAWLQWRLAVNGLRGGRRRDTLERASRWLDVLTPVAMAVLGIPLVLLLIVLGAVGGFALARGASGSGTVEAVVSLVLLLPLALVTVRPIFRAGRGYLERSDLVRLLPIPRSLLFNLEFVRAAADPAVLVFAPAMVAVPCGALAGGAGSLAAAALLAGIAFLVVLVALGGLVVVAAQLLLRDRRRAEAAALVLAVGVMALNFLPQIVARERPARRTPAAPSAGPPRGAPGQGPDRVVLPAALRVLPSSVYATALGRAASGEWLASAGGLGVLVLVAAGCYGVAGPLQRRLLETPARSSARARAVRQATWTLPFVSQTTAAVAAVQVRTILRTVRGRWGLIAPPLFGVFFAFAFSRASGRHSPDFFGSPLVVTIFVVFIALQSLAALSANQFASDGRGLPMLFLQPLAVRTLVRGKALGIGILQVGCMVLGLLPVVVLERPAQPSVSLAVFLGGLAAMMVLAPVAAALSAVFPKRVDLSRWGRSSNPHATSGLVSFLASGLGAGPPAGAVLLASGVLHRPWLAPLMMVGWLAIAGAVAWLMLPVAERILVKRRENLALVVLGD